jgi:hypothetical protein
MRSVLLAVAALLLIAPAAGAAFTPIASLPAQQDEVPQVLAFGEGGRGVVVSRVGFELSSDAALQTVALPSGRRLTFPRTALVDSVARPEGGVDLLVRRTPELPRGDLILRRVLPTGRIYDLWSVRTAATEGAVARRGGTVVVTWPEGSTLRFVSRRDGGIPTRPRVARLGLRSVNDLDLALDTRGRRVVAATSFRAGLVLASIGADGRVLQRQAAPRVEGLVELARTLGGRIGALVEDTGIEGDRGECVTDGGGRHLRAAIRERGAARFGAVRTIESPPFGCGSSGAQLLGLPDGRLVAVYQGGSYDRPPLVARIAVAPEGRRFGALSTLASDARADTAALAAGRLFIALLRRTTEPQLFLGALSVRELGGTEQPITDTASSPVLAADGTGVPVLAWRTGDRLLVALDR